jgi:hypothetical protein
MDVTKGVTADQQFVKIMYDELINVMGGGPGEEVRVYTWHVCPHRVYVCPRGVHVSVRVLCFPSPSRG